VPHLLNLAIHPFLEALRMRSPTPVDPLVYDYHPAYTALGQDDTPSLPPVASRTAAFPVDGSTRSADTGVEFLNLYRQLLADIESWCEASGAPITQMIRREALRDYVEVYCHTYPRQPSYPFPPRFSRYAAYLDGFDDIVQAIDAWCEWLSRQFLPGVVPIDLIRSALDEWDQPRPADRLYARALQPAFSSLVAHQSV
jgi:hypothetical protein